MTQVFIVPPRVYVAWLERDGAAWTGAPVRPYHLSGDVTVNPYGAQQ